MTNHFRYFFLLAALSLIFFSMSFSQKKFDVIILKSGGKVVGTILDKHQNQPVTVQLESGNKLTIQWDEIKSFDVLVVKEKSVDEKIKEESANDADVPWRLIYFSGGGFRVNRLDSLTGSFLSTTSNNKSIRVPIDSIAVLVHFKEGHFWIGAGIGFLAGTVTGAVIAGLNVPKQDPTKPLASFGGLEAGGEIAVGMLIGAPLGFFTGGVIAGTDGYETYDLMTQKDVKMKRQILQQAIDN